MCVAVGTGPAETPPPLPLGAPLTLFLYIFSLDEVLCAVGFDLQERPWSLVCWMPPRVKTKQGSQQWSRGHCVGRDRRLVRGGHFQDPQQPKSPRGHYSSI